MYNILNLNVKKYGNILILNICKQFGKVLQLTLYKCSSLLSNILIFINKINQHNSDFDLEVQQKDNLTLKSKSNNLKVRVYYIIIRDVVQRMDQVFIFIVTTAGEMVSNKTDFFQLFFQNGNFWSSRTVKNYLKLLS